MRLLRLAPKKINDFLIVRVEIATVACGSFAMTLMMLMFFLKNRHFLPVVFYCLSELEAWSSEAASPGSSAMVWEAGSSIIDISDVYSG